MFLRFFLVALACVSVGAATLDLFSALSNGYLITDEGVSLLIDCGEYEVGVVPDVVPWILANGLDHLFITHAHMDHFGNLPLIVEAAPNVQVWVGSEGIKNAIINGPEMPPYAPAYASFDFSSIKVLPSSALDVLPTVSLTVETNVRPEGESPAASYVFGSVNGTKGIFSGDLVYGLWFSWLGEGGPSPSGIVSWLADLKAIQRRFKGKGYTLYAGHGQIRLPFDETIDINVEYISWLVDAVCVRAVPWTAEGIMAQALSAFPSFDGTFLWECCFLTNPLFAAPATCPAAPVNCYDSQDVRCEPSSRRLLFGATCVCDSA